MTPTTQQPELDPVSTGEVTTGEPVKPSPVVESAPDAQRAAMRDLVLLATESAATEARIDRELQSVLQEAAETLEKSSKNIRYRNESLQEQARQKHADALADIATKYQADQEAIRRIEEPTRQRIEGEFEQTRQLVEKKIGEASWLSDSDLEVTLNTLAAEEKKLHAEVSDHLARLDGVQREAIERCITFRHRPSEAELAVGSPATGSADVLPQSVPADPGAAFNDRRDQVALAYSSLKKLGLPKLFVGITPALILFMFAVVAAGIVWATTGFGNPDIKLMAIAGGGAIVIALLAGAVLRGVARRQVQHAFLEFQKALAAARQMAQVQLQVAADAREKARERAAHKRDSEILYATEKYAPGGVNARKKLESQRLALSGQTQQARDKAESERTTARSAVETRNDRLTRELGQRLKLDLQGAQLAHDRQVSEAQQRYDETRTALEARLRDGLATIRAPIDASASAGSGALLDWESPEWATWKPSTRFAEAIRFGQLHVDLLKIARASSEGGEVRLPLPPPFELPAPLAFPNRASMLIQADRDGRADAIRAIQMVMSRLLVSLPPGRVRFTLLDPVGLGQNFAGFMHLADHDDQLVGGRIWTEQEQIDQRLNYLTGHMETVIQKYLRNEFETIDDYNAQAGELAEPYRFLVISDFPAGFNDESLRRLSSVASSGARCGVYTLIYQDTRQAVPLGTTLDDLMANSVTLAREENRFVWRDPIFAQFPLRLDPPPSELALTRICDWVGRGAKEAARVEVPFETIAPAAAKIWSLDSGGDIHVPVGRLGATRLQYMRLGKGVAQHVLIAGKTGSGKSTLLHAMVTNLALWYSPDQVEFYLIDFKKGVEFKTYATYSLPHARAIAVESDREFGLSVLQRLDAELTRRGELFRAAGVQDLASYRRSPSPIVMPRTLLIIDEFQEFFSEDDKLAQDSSVLLDRLVRQGRAFGIHCLLGSQTIAGASGLPRSTIGQMAVRVALQTSEADSQLILGDNNSAARLLSRPGEAIYNDQGGLVEGNSPFQVAWLADAQKDRYLAMIRARADLESVQSPAPIVFEGNAPADLARNRRLMDLLGVSPATPWQGPPRAWIGDPVAIKEATGVNFRRQSGANLLVIGQQEDAALATMLASLLSLTAQLPVSGSRFYILDATPADSSLAGTFASVVSNLSHDVRLVEWRAVGEAINEIHVEMMRRRDEHDLAAAPFFLFVYGLQRYRVLRKSEDDFGFSVGGNPDEPKPADPGKQFAELLKEGPPVGIHTLAWADTAIAVDRTLDRGSLREFDNRVLFQMSANDSSNLIDSPAANKLGQHRALVYSEEQGIMEKFRPYALPPTEILERAKARMTKSE